MPKKLKILIGISAFFIFSISASGFAEAQVPSVPDPVNSDGTCFDEIGGTKANPILKQVPCKSSPENLTSEKDTSFPIENIKKNSKKILDDLLGSYRELKALFNKWVLVDTVRWIFDFFSGLDKNLKNLQDLFR